MIKHKTCAYFLLFRIKNTRNSSFVGIISIIRGKHARNHVVLLRNGESMPVEKG